MDGYPMAEVLLAVAAKEAINNLRSISSHTKIVIRSDAARQQNRCSRFVLPY
jgi:hypothetical protein